jgi:hypothetical protein
MSLILGLAAGKKALGGTRRHGRRHGADPGRMMRPYIARGRITSSPI